MAIQFAGSSSTGNRRRRRLVVNGDGAGVDSSLLDGDGAEIESQLVASAAAGPWVPVTEMRIWIYATLIAVFLGTLTSALACPGMVHTNLTPLTDHLLAGPRPVLVVYTEVALLAMSAQMGILIAWYRSRCRLDFGGRHRVWPWAAGLFGIAAFYLATDAHRTFGQLVGIEKWLSWRGHTVTWLLPICLAALPISLFLDRDVRNNRSSLWTLRLSGILWLTEAWFEVYQPELQSQPWFPFAFLVIPLYASATLFVGLWLHARIVAYVCPDPPELEERSALSSVLAACGFVGRLLMFWRRRGATAEGEEDETKPKRRRKKAEGEAEAETTTKRKRKAPAKRTTTTRTRTRTKPAEEEVEEESSDETNTEESDSGNEPESSAADSNSSWNDNQDQWEEEAVEPPQAKASAAESKGNGRFTQVHKSHGQAAPAPHSRKQSQSWEEASNDEEEAQSQSNDSSDDGDDDGQNESGLTADQTKGLSKRQKRELKKQQRDQERSRGR